MDQATKEQAVALGTQLGVAGVTVLLMTLVHAVGLLIILRAFHLAPERLAERRINAHSMLLLGSFGVALFALHLVEIAIFAAFYRVIGALETVEEALFYSASAYATLGRPTEGFPQDWRLIVALEALVGFVLISWSAAFIVSAVNKLREETE